MSSLTEVSLVLLAFSVAAAAYVHFTTKHDKAHHNN